MPETPAEITPATPEAPATATPEPPKATPEPPKKAASPWEDPTAAKAEIERLRRENASDRTSAKATAADEARKELAQTIGKALGLVNDEPVDPAELTKQLTATQAKAQQAALELAIFRSAPDASVANALLDSRSFLAKIADLDPTDATAITAAVVEAVGSIPALGKRSPAPNPAQGSSASGPGTAGQLTQADLDGLARDNKYAEIDKARIDGRLNTLLGIT